MASALITGASTGLGREFAAMFAADRCDCILVSSERSQTALRELAHELEDRHRVTVQTISLDLAEEGAAARLDARVQELGGEVDFLVNNAGVGIVGLRIQDCDPGEVSRMLHLNVLTLTELTMLHLPRMVERGHGGVLNVSSIAAYVVPHGVEAAYAASKAYVRSFSEAVTQDLKGTGVTCTHVAPGPTRTEFFTSAGLENASRLGGMFMDAEPVARAGYDALRAGRASVVPGVGTKVMRAAAALSPSPSATARVSGYFVTRH